MSYQLDVLAAAGTDVTAFVSTMKGAQQVAGGWSLDLEQTFPDEVVDTLAALRALTTAGAADTTTVSRALGYLLDAQNADSGWGVARNRPSKFFYAAEALVVLDPFRTTFGLGTVTSSALSYYGEPKYRLQLWAAGGHRV